MFFSVGVEEHRSGSVLKRLPTAEFVIVTLRRRDGAVSRINSGQAHHVV
jgi:hypothetical protein